VLLSATGDITGDGDQHRHRRHQSDQTVSITSNGGGVTSVPRQTGV
jgi:YD repeat-containing protein